MTLGFLGASNVGKTYRMNIRHRMASIFLSSPAAMKKKAIHIFSEQREG